MLSLMSPLLVQYSVLQMSPDGAGAAMAAPCECAAEVRPNTPAPTPRPAALRMVRRASACLASVAVCSVMVLSMSAFSLDRSVLDWHGPYHSGAVDATLARGD